MRASTLRPDEPAAAPAGGRAIATRRAAILRLEADRPAARGCGAEARGDEESEPNNCDYARLFHALALFHSGGAAAFGRANEDVADSIAPLQGDLRGANAFTREGKRRHAPITFHFQRALLIQRLIRSFGEQGAVARGALSAANERQLRLVAGQWASGYCRVADADPARTWRIYQSENHHAQLVASCWAVADLARDGQGAPRYADGSTAAQQYARWTAYARAWLAQRVRYGLIEYFSPTYTGYTLETAYAYAQFAQDPALRRAATVLLDRWWSDWAQQQIDGVFGGGMTRVYGAAIAGGSPMQIAAWAYFGIGARPNPNPAAAAALTSGYSPPAAVLAAATRARPATPRCIRETAPGRLAGPRDREWFTVDPALPAVLRTTCVAQGYVMGSAGEPVLPLSSWSGGSQQNEMAAIAFAGGPRNRIAIVGAAPDGRSTYNAMVAVQDGGAMLVKPPGRGGAKGATGLRVWFGPGLKRTESDGWVFVEGSARAALRPSAGGYRWDGNWLTPDDPAAGVAVRVATLQSGTAAAFQRAVAQSRVTDNGADATLAGGSGGPLRLDTEQGQVPHIGARAIDFRPRVRAD